MAELVAYTGLHLHKLIKNIIYYVTKIIDLIEIFFLFNKLKHEDMLI